MLGPCAHGGGIAQVGGHRLESHVLRIRRTEEVHTLHDGIGSGHGVRTALPHRRIVANPQKCRIGTRFRNQGMQTRNQREFAQFAYGHLSAPRLPSDCWRWHRAVPACAPRDIPIVRPQHPTEWPLPSVPGFGHGQ